MFQLDLLSRVPVYNQIINQLEAFVLSDLMPSHTQLPSVRKLSVELSINPNTIQKAYSELDRKGIIYSVPGRGCFVSEDAKHILSRLSRAKLKPLTALLSELKLAGIKKDEIIAIVDDVFEKGDKHD